MLFWNGMDSNVGSKLLAIKRHLTPSKNWQIVMVDMQPALSKAPMLILRLSALLY